MKILVWGINYTPEVTGIGPCNTALCEHLRAAGHEVEMVTTFAYYPSWQKRPEDRGRLWRTDDVAGVPVHRCWHYVPAKVTWWKRILHEATFVATSLPRVLTRPAPQVLVAVSPPLLLGLASWLAATLRGARHVFHIQDLQPDAAVGLGMLKPNLFTRLLYAVEAFSYRKAWKVSGISDGMLAAFTAKGVPKEKQLYFPNGIELNSLPERGHFRARHGFAEDDFLAVYSGNIGVKQGLEILIDAARLVKHPKVRIVICGDGAQRPRLEALARELPNLRLFPLLPEAEYREMLADAQAALITQVKASGRAFFPSKLLNALAASLPILSVADEESELARAVAESGCGMNILPGEPQALAELLDRLATDRTALEGYGKAGFTWVSQFERKRVLDEFLAAISQGAR